MLVLCAALMAAVVMTLVWWRQVYTKNAGVVDGWWSYMFGLIAVLYGVLGSGDPMRKALLVTCVLLWSARLGTHLLIRNSTHATEDERYRKLRQEYGDVENFLMWRFFMYQALSNVILSAPFLITCLDPSPVISPWMWGGVVLWTIAVAGESVADHQLRTFRKDPANKGKVCEAGLWNYSRHPNYFFEWLIWVSFALMAMQSPYGWAALVCPVIIYILLTKITGIPMLEELSVKSKGQLYIRYQQTTSAFFPWFKK
jgi:steroid 5-alpha reductase family enzyme